MDALIVYNPDKFFPVSFSTPFPVVQIIKRAAIVSNAVKIYILLLDPMPLAMLAAE